ncbi:MAG: hypothetical protein PHG66_05765 [Candidatus Colwellbacteria bacterium]|nr:hypothetical protein [Candidatus Colwellbacteria bacterium]
MENTAKLSSFGSLMKGAVNDFKARWKLALAFGGLSILVNFALGVIVGAAALLSMNSAALGIAVGAIFGIIAMLAAYLVSGALTYSMKDGSGVKESLGYIWKNFRSYLLVVAVMGVVILTGVMALVIPGLILSVTLGFATFVFMDEGKKGFSSLARSKEYVKGYFWPVVGKFCLYVLVIIGTLIVTSLLMGVLSLISETVGNLFQSAVNIFIVTPLSICFAWRLYKDLKSKKPELAEAPIAEKTKWMKVMFGIGLALIAAAIVIFSIFGSKIMTEILSEVDSAATDDMPAIDINSLNQ